MGLSFASLEYVVFLGVSFALLACTRSVWAKKWLLIVSSYLFYLTFGVAGVLVVTLIAFADYYVGQRLGASLRIGPRKRWLWVGLAVNLGPLVLFKYSVFSVDSVASVLRLLGLHLSVRVNPGLAIIGISYFTFSGLSYVLDIYYETIEPTDCLSNFVCYLLYFPKLIAGPIVRAGELLPQLTTRLQLTPQDVETGCAYLLIGAVKKLVIADQLAPHVSMIFAAPQHYNAFTLVQGLIGYTVQIYADFSGYSDIAIGCARLIGIRLPQNFLMPYSSVNIVEFWRRWHVTMSSWFRDYIFLPLEMGSRYIRSPKIRASRNMVITMVLCGLWHGASWNFVLWGGLHGVALAAYQLYAGVRPEKVRRGTRSPLYLGRLVARALTLSVVMVGWILFGTSTLTTAFTYLSRMFTWANDGVSLGSPYILPLAAAVFLIHLIINKDSNIAEELATYSVPARVVTYAALLMALTSLVPSQAVPFVYVQF